MGAFDLDRFQLFLVDLDVFALFQLIAAGLLFALDHIAGLGVDHLLLQRLPVSLLIMWKWVFSTDVVAG